MNEWAVSCIIGTIHWLMILRMQASDTAAPAESWGFCIISCFAPALIVYECRACQNAANSHCLTPRQSFHMWSSHQKIKGLSIVRKAHGQIEVQGSAATLHSGRTRNLHVISGRFSGGYSSLCSQRPARLPGAFCMWGRSLQAQFRRRILSLLFFSEITKLRNEWQWSHTS